MIMGLWTNPWLSPRVQGKPRGARWAGGGGVGYKNIKSSLRTPFVVLFLLLGFKPEVIKAVFDGSPVMIMVIIVKINTFPCSV